MPKPISWSPQANEDLDGIMNYLASKWDNSVSIKFLNLVDTIVKQIAINPRQSPVINKSLNIRKCVITKHNTLYYRNRRADVEIVRIYDTRQDPEKLTFNATSG
jgi:plasmid stabilization system protein ParE